MEITYIGHSCFKIKDDITLVIDPYDEKIGYKMPKLKADVVACTHTHSDHHNIGAVSDYRLLIDGPGEYEISNTFIYGFPTFHDDKEGKERGENTIYSIEMEEINLLHLGDVGHELDQSTVEKLPYIDVLMIPVGGKYTINSKTASKIISNLEPGLVIPMHYDTKELKGIEGLDPLEKFLEEMGVQDTVKEKDKLKITSKSDIPEETEIVILKPAH